MANSDELTVPLLVFLKFIFVPKKIDTTLPRLLVTRIGRMTAAVHAMISKVARLIKRVSVRSARSSLTRKGL